MEKFTGKGVAKKLNQHQHYLLQDFFTWKKTHTHNQKQNSITPIVTEHTPNQYTALKGSVKDKKINNVLAGTLQTLRHWPKHNMAGKKIELINSPKRKKRLRPLCKPRRITGVSGMGGT